MGASALVGRDGAPVGLAGALYLVVAVLAVFAVAVLIYRSRR